MVKNFCDLTGRKAVVFGGAGGIGQSIAEALTLAGAQVMITSRKIDSLKKASEEIQLKTGNKILYGVCDATVELEVEKILRDAIENMGEVDILVNSQGYNKRYPGTEFPVDEWDALFSANVKSVMLTCKHFGKYMKENNIHGKIINLSSVRGIRALGNGGNGTVGYCSTKGAVEMLTKSYASDLGPNIQVNALGPTIVYTEMMVGALPADETERNKMAAATPSKRIGYPDDIKGPAVFLASSASNFITGSTIYLDGGLTAIG